MPAGREIFHCDNQPAASVLLIFQFPQGHAAPSNEKGVDKAKRNIFLMGHVQLPIY